MPPTGPSHPPPDFPVLPISLTITVFVIFVLWFKRVRFSFDRWFVFFLLTLSCLHFAHILRRDFGRSYFVFVFLFFIFKISEESRWLFDLFFGPEGRILKRSTFVSLLFYSGFSSFGFTKPKRNR
ncbi:hypothetical protein DLM75_21910 [Leptospira stimsonii]|uniref:Uncharacterized protein n=1 Tax=Leptospira stimsonii TaxID=2202203 RepID=A0A396YPI7_9LEPT|nr:hypothetical protein DLM75_21910 [Leptospira stimsonii]